MYNGVLLIDYLFKPHLLFIHLIEHHLDISTNTFSNSWERHQSSSQFISHK